MNRERKVRNVNKLLTRREVIGIWSRQKNELLDTYVCPKCRDLLYQKDHCVFICRECQSIFILTEEKKDANA
ncbi:MAG: hypothetical protein JXB50_16915 [Spirochaetes bacterium]|nr:hypothetical protein [Spirochaetota bacterium]